MQPLTKYILGALLMMVTALTGMVWNTMAQQVQENSAGIEAHDEDIDTLEDAIKDLSRQGKVQAKQSAKQTETQEKQTEILQGIWEEMREDRE